MYSNPHLYSQCNKGQVDDATKILQQCSISWAGNDNIMDAGCGSGDITKHILCTISPNICKVVGVDISTDMVNYARQFNDDPKITYCEADVEDQSTFPKDWIGAFSKIFSFTALHWVPNHTKVFKNFNSFLKPNGEVIAFFIYDFPRWNKACNDVMKGKWQMYLKDFRTTHICVENIGEMDNQEWLKSENPLHEYRILVEKQGFRVKSIKSVSTQSYAYSYEQCQQMYLAICPQLAMIPETLHTEFVKDFMQALDLSVNEKGIIDAGEGVKYVLVHAVKY